MQYRRWTLLLAAILFTSIVMAACGGGAADTETAETGSETTVEQESSSDAAGESDSAESESASSDNATASDSAAAPAAGLRTFTIVPEESTASYVVQEEFLAGALAKLGINAGNVEVVGTSDEVAGQLQLDLGGDSPLGENEFTVNLARFVTDQDRRDNWIRDNGNGPNFASAPTAKFVASGIDGAPADYSDGQEVTFTLNGDLTIKDATNPVSFAVTATLNGDTISGSASTPSKLTDWGIEPPNFANTLTVADEFEIRLDFVAKE